jgi:signal transduction histidine kinase
MSTVQSELALLRHPRLAALATSAWPAWLWSADGSRILWANAVGAAMFGAETSGSCAGRHFYVTDLPAAQIIRLAATLPPGGQERLERLRGFGGGFGRALTCACSRIVAGDGKGAVLVAAAERAGPAFTLVERVRRLLGDSEDAVAAFAPDGGFLYANPAGRRLLAGATNLSALGVGTLAAAALESASATGTARVDGRAFDAAVVRLGRDASCVLLVVLQPSAGEASAQTAEQTVASDVPPEPVLSHADAEAAAAFMSLGETKPVVARGEPLVERRHPLRFVWHLDADGHFAIASDEFIQLIGPENARVGGGWSEVAAALQLDPDDRVGRALASRETWSGIVVSWPVGGADTRLPIELSGLPVFDRDRTFRGYRGFGVCRDVERINALVRTRREERSVSPSSAETPEPNDIPVAPRSAAAADKADEPEAAENLAAENLAAENLAAENLANVVPFRPASPAEPKNQPSLSPVERKAFRELAQELTSRLRGSHLQAPGDGALQGAAQGAVQELPTASEAPAPAAATNLELALLDRIPLGVLVYRDATLIYANRHFLEWSGYAGVAAIEAAGGLHMLFAEPDAAGAVAETGGAQSLAIRTGRGDSVPVEGRMFTVSWNGSSAIALILANDQIEGFARIAEDAPRAAETEIAELRSMLDTARRQAEEELRNAKRESLHAASAKGEFLAKISHEIRTPLNAMMGLAEAIMAERFGPIGNERYREYIKDIHAAGSHLAATINDLLDLSKLETGRIELSFADVNLNDLTQQCAGIMQPQANSARIIIRTALTAGLPHVLADERSLRQIVFNLISNSIRLTGPGGQIIISTAFSDAGEVILRVRDTGVGMSEKDIDAATEPFGDVATSTSSGSGGTGFGVSLAKALAKANHANFNIKSAPDAGTLIEIAFPPNRIAAAQT